jgi:hypothetical protein
VLVGVDGGELVGPGVEVEVGPGGLGRRRDDRRFTIDQGDVVAGQRLHTGNRCGEPEQRLGDPDLVQHLAGRARRRTAVGGHRVNVENQAGDLVDERPQIEWGQGDGLHHHHPVQQPVGRNRQREIDLHTDVVPSVHDGVWYGRKGQSRLDSGVVRDQAVGVIRAAVALHAVAVVLVHDELAPLDRERLGPRVAEAQDGGQGGFVDLQRPVQCRLVRPVHVDVQVGGGLRRYYPRWVGPDLDGDPGLPDRQPENGLVEGDGHQGVLLLLAGKAKLHGIVGGRGVRRQPESRHRRVGHLEEARVPLQVFGGDHPRRLRLAEERRTEMRQRAYGALVVTVDVDVLGGFVFGGHDRPLF